MSGRARWRKRPTLEPSRFTMEEVAEALGRKRRGLGPTGPVELPECAAESIKEGPGHGGPAWAQLDAARAPGARRR